MKKLLSGLVVVLGMFMGGCSNRPLIATVPTNEIQITSKSVDISVDRILEPQIFLKMKNKTDDIVEVLLEESNINNTPIYDGEEILSVISHNNSSNWNSFSNSMDSLSMSLGGRPSRETSRDTSTKKLENRSKNILLNPRDEVVKRIGYGFKIEYPVKITLKIKKGDTVDYASLSLENSDKKIELDRTSYEILEKSEN